jgi:aldose 1-epimerase
LNAIGLYTFSPADPEYIITVPLFDQVVFDMGGLPFRITKVNGGKKITHITYDGQTVNGYFISHDALKKGGELVITTESNDPRISMEEWGFDSKPVYLYTLSNSNGVTVKVTNYGCTIVAYTAPDRKGEMENIVLGFDNLDAYQGRHPCFGCIVGRCANRISGAKFTLGDTEYTLAANSGENHIHGGIENFSRKVWDTTATSSDKQSASVSFAYVSSDMEEGYPGELSVRVDYVLTNDNELQLHYAATTDRPTVINLTNHAYFNLSGCKENIGGHQVRIFADRYTPSGEGLIPTGEIAPVEGTPYDLRQWTTLSDRMPALPAGHFDTNYCVQGTPGNSAWVAEMYDPESGRLLRTYTTEPGLQFYVAPRLRYKTAEGYAYSGACFEAQHYPDSPNHPNFPSIVLRPGETYKQTTLYAVGVRQ